MMQKPKRPMLFTRTHPTASMDSQGDFGYLPADACYLDSACQTLRPRAVIDAETEYYLQYNACGGRVKYRWGTLVDEKVRRARHDLLAFAGKSEKDYAVAFTLNTTYGINLVLHQLPEDFASIMTSEIEHNSVHLPSISWAKRRSAGRAVVPRRENGDVAYEQATLDRTVVLVNTMSNIDGRAPSNLAALAKETHHHGGLLLLDAAQGFAHDPEAIRKIDYDAAFGSGHKMYGPSIGFVILKRTLLDLLDPFFVGGGTVSDARRDDYDLLRSGDEAHAILEPGLQNWGGILGLGEAVRWMQRTPSTEDATAARLFEGLQAEPRVHVLNGSPSPIVSFWVDGMDAHQLALYLSQRDIMCRSGYFCCHSYLEHQLHSPPLLRVSLGRYNTESHVDTFLTSLRTILSTL